MSVRRAFAALLLLHAGGLAACATPPFAPRDTGQLVFWHVARADGAGGSADLLGTLHVAQAALALDPAVEHAFDAADELVLEVSPEELAPGAARELIQRLGPLPEGQTLRDVVSPELFAAVEAEFAARGIALEPWLGWEPWVVALAIAGDALASEGYAHEHGVERKLASDASSAPRPKPVRGLESAELQIARLDALSPETQELLLADAISGSGRRSSVAVITDAWHRGDLRAIEREIFRKLDGAGAAEFFEAIYFARNREFAAGIARLVDGGGRWFVALGTAHVVGERGVPELLAARGYRVERIANRSVGAGKRAKER